MRLPSSSRWRGVIEASMRCVAAARRARMSTSSSRVRGFSGKRSPYFDMKSSKSSCVCSPLESRSSMSFRSDIIWRTRSMAAGSGLASASRRPLNWLSSTSLRSRSRSSSKVCLAAAERHSYELSSWMALAVSSGSASSSDSRSRASSDGSGNSSARSCPIALSSSALARSSVPSRRPRSRRSRRRRRTSLSMSSSPRRSWPPGRPRLSRSRRAWTGVEPDRIASPISSSAARTS